MANSNYLSFRPALIGVKSDGSKVLLCDDDGEPLAPLLNASGSAISWGSGSNVTEVRETFKASNKNVGREWTRLFGPNDLKTWTKSSEWTGGYPVQSFEVFRREGAAMKFDSRYLTTTYGTLSNFSVPAVNMSGGRRIGILCYCHRLNTNTVVALRVGSNSSNFKTYTFSRAYNMLVEGWNFLVVHTQEDGTLKYLQSGLTEGWANTAGSFDFETQTVGFMAVQVTGFQGANYPIIWIEGIYLDGAESPLITIGFDIQGSSLELAKTILDRYGFAGYAAIPTANGDSANPMYLLSQTDRNRLIALYNSGWDVIAHSASHNSLGSITDAERISCELQSVRQQLLRLGMYRGADLFASPNGSWSNRTIYELAKHGYRWQRNVSNAPIPQYDSFVGPINQLTQGAITCGASTLSQLINRVDHILLKYKANCHFYTHEVEEGGNGTNWPADTLRIYSYTLDGLCAHLKKLQDAGLCTVVTPSQYLARIGSVNPLDTFCIPHIAELNVSPSPCLLTNPANLPVLFVVAGGVVSEIAYSKDNSNFIPTGLSSGVFRVEPGDTLRITYTSAPKVTQLRI
jgi:peptidoglycan/xylan/chitin deacetylase (PgdA/CDA1 family)